MRTSAALLAALGLLSLGGAAVAQTAAVTITRNGYVPQSLTIHPGDTVIFTNGDNVAHQVTFKSATGVTCSPNPLVLQPAANGSCVFANAGSYSYSDPNVKGNTFRGTVTVEAPPDSLTMAVKPTLLVFGGKVSGTGTVSTQKSGETVDVLAQQCGASSSHKATTVQSLTGGTYAFSVQPLMNTIYTTKLRAASSPRPPFACDPGSVSGAWRRTGIRSVCTPVSPSPGSTRHSSDTTAACTVGPARRRFLSRPTRQA